MLFKNYGLPIRAQTSPQIRSWFPLVIADFDQQWWLQQPQVMALSQSLIPMFQEEMETLAQHMSKCHFTKEVMLTFDLGSFNKTIISAAQ